MSRPHGQITASNSRICILVDDDARVRDALENLLNSAGLTVHAYAAAKELLRADSLNQADCVITDVRMPDIDGWELQRRIAAEHPDLPVILMTAHQDAAAAARARVNGAFAFFYKPFDGEELLRVVMAAMGSRLPHPLEAPRSP
jgi:two-component system, LuxR family, response regulator FixJ